MTKEGIRAQAFDAPSVSWLYESDAFAVKSDGGGLFVTIYQKDFGAADDLRTARVDSKVVEASAARGLPATESFEDSDEALDDALEQKLLNSEPYVLDDFPNVFLQDESATELHVQIDSALKQKRQNQFVDAHLENYFPESSPALPFMWTT